jgi:hypothetical protein
MTVKSLIWYCALALATVPAAFAVGDAQDLSPRVAAVEGAAKAAQSAGVTISELQALEDSGRAGQRMDFQRLGAVLGSRVFRDERSRRNGGGDQ